MKDYPNIQKLIDKHSKALNSNSKEIRLSTIEIGNILNDITKLSVSIQSEKENNEKLRQAIIELKNILLEALQNDSSDTF